MKVIREKSCSVPDGMCYKFDGKDYDALAIVSALHDNIIRNQNPTFCAYRRDSVHSDSVTLILRDADLRQAVRDLKERLTNILQQRDAYIVQPTTLGRRSS